MLKVRVAMLVAVLFLIGLHVYEIVDAHKVHASDGAQRIVFDAAKVDDPIQYYSDGTETDRSFHYECPNNTVAIAP